MSHCNCPLEEVAKEEPLSPALKTQEASFTYSALNQLATDLMGELVRFNVQPNDRIACLLPPTPQAIALFFAVFRLGASICPLSSRVPPSQIQTHLQRLSPKLFIESFPISSPSLSISPGPGQSVFLFTSGSTATPKIAVLSLQSLLANASSYPSLDLDSKSRYLLSLPLFHVSGLGILFRSILARACIVLDPNDPSITHLSCVPTQLTRGSYQTKNLKCLLLGGAPIASYPTHLPIFISYGLTETGSMVLLRKSPPQINGLFHLGSPLCEREIKVNPDGEILVRGKTLFQGYWEKDKLTPAPPWFSTGDLAQVDPVQGIAIKGRKDWQFISGGENIQPEEIEQQLLQIPEIINAVVVPKSDPEFGARPVAFVQSSDPSLTLTRIQSCLIDKLPKYKLPVALFLIDEFPKIGMKIDRKSLAQTANRT